MPRPDDPIQALLVAARRNQILEAATAVFAAKGYHRATIKEIARTAGMAEGTIYNYFASKEALLLALLDRLNQTEERPAHFAEAAEADFPTFFRDYLRRRMALIRQSAQVVQAVLPEVLASPELRELYGRQVIGPTMQLAERYLQGLMAGGQVRPMDPQLLARVLAGAVAGQLLLLALGDAEADRRWEEMAEMLADLLLDGLRPADRQGGAPS